jgi:hypothetical protein
VASDAARRTNASTRDSFIIEVRELLGTAKAESLTGGHDDGGHRHC